jgi:beta-phosphoglucomutase
MKVKACLFDLDGVLVDTARFHFLAWRKLAVELGFEFTEADNEQLKGVSRMDSLEILLRIGKKSLTQEEKDRYAAEKNEVYLGYVKQMTPADILPGVTEFMSEVRKNQIMIGLGSASKNARLILERTGIVTLFDVIVDGNLITHAKPDPEVFAMGAQLLEIENKACIVFEDAVAGVQAAHNAGMKCIGIGSPEILGEADMVLPGFLNLKLADLDLVFS